MTHRRSLTKKMGTSFRLAVLLAVTMVALPVMAQKVKSRQSGLDDLAYAAPELWTTAQGVDINQFRESLTGNQATKVMPVLEAYDAFLSREGTESWRMTFDRMTGEPSLVEGGGIPWIPGTANDLTSEMLGLAPFVAGRNVPVDVVAGEALDFMRANKGLFGADAGDLKLNRADSGPVLDYLYFVDFDWTFHGIPVKGAHVVFRLNHGNMVQFGQELISPAIMTLDTVPYITRETAWQTLWGYVGGRRSGDVLLERGRLVIVPVSTKAGLSGQSVEAGAGIGYKLAYVLDFRRSGVMGTWEARIDAHTGEVLSFGDSNKYGHVQGGIYKTDKNPSQTEVSSPLPYANVGGGAYADAAGNYTGTSGISTLNGKYVKIVDTCGSLSQSADGTGLVDFGSSSGTDCTTPGHGGSGNTHASRTQYWNVTQIKLKALTYMPTNSWLNAQVTDNVNLNQTCNAYWDGTALNFFKSGGGCNNTGELPGVSLHEWGHGLDTNDGNGFSPDNGTGESYADITAVLQTHQSCLGGGFLGSNCSGYGDACTNCTGVRDIDYGKHSSNTPATPLNFIKTDCPTSTNYKGPCGKEGHCESYVSSEAVWDLATRDLVSWGLDTTSAWQLVDRLWYASRSTSTAAFTCTAGSYSSNGCGTGSFFSVFRVIDDCDGDLSNGTPHASAIYSAFNRHAIACSAVVNTDQTNCCPTLAAPVPSGSAGNNTVYLSWNSVTNAVTYNVYRNETSCTAGFTKVGTTTDPTTSFTDTGVANGVTYYYRVEAVASSESCTSPMSACVTVVPQPCTTPGTPTGLSASVPGDNEIDLSWSTGSPAGDTYNVYRTTGSCPGSGYSLLVSGVTSLSYADTTVSGQTTYSYEVKAVDSTGGCESLASGCASATATGACTAAPTFAGLASVTNPGNATCELDLAWSAATPNCGSSVSYNVYRSTSSSFTPAASNMIATGVTATAYSDTNALANGSAYYYIVRAVDASTGAEDANASALSGVPMGPSTTSTPINETFEEVGGEPTSGGTWSHTAAQGTDDWAQSTSGNPHSGSHTFFSSDVASLKDDYLVTPAILLGNVSAQLSFWHTYYLESSYDGAVIEVSTDGGSTWTDLGSQITQGGYTGTISTSYSSPIAGRQAWTGGTIGAETQVIVDLSPYLGQTVQIRFRQADDVSVNKTGWYIDDVVVTTTGGASCATAGAVKPVPDGKWVSGTAMQATKTAADGSAVGLTWDTTTCTDANYNLYYGNGSDVSTYTLQGSDCGLGNSGTASGVTLPAVPAGQHFIWWIIAGTDGVQTESSWGKDSAGSERHAAPSGQCGFTAKSPATTCP